MRNIILTLIFFTTFATNHLPLNAQDTIRLEEVQRLGNGSIRDSAWNVDGTMIGVAGDLGIWIYTDTFDLIQHIKTKAVQSLVWRPDSTQVVALYEDRVTVWDIATAQPVFTQNEASCPVEFSPDNQKLVIGKANSEIDVVDTSSWQKMSTYQDHLNEQQQRRGIQTLAWVSDSQSVMSITYDAIHRWDAVSGNIQSKVALADGFLYESPCANWIKWSPDRSRIFGYGDYGESFGIWDTSTGERIAFTDENLTFYLFMEVTWSSNGTHIAITDWFQEVTVMDAESLELAYNFIPYATKNVPEEFIYLYEWDYSLDWREDRILLSTVGDVRVVDATTGMVLHSMSEFSASINSIRWNSDGTRLLSGHGNKANIHFGDNRFRVWDTNSRELLQSCEVFSGFIRVVIWSKSANKVIVTSSAGRPWGAISKWDIDTCEVERYLFGSLGAPYVSMNYASNIVAIGDAFETTDLVNDTFELDTRIDTFSSTVEWDHNGYRFARTGGGNISVISWPEQDQINMEIVHHGYVFDLTWSSDDRQLASLDRNGVIAFWTLEDNTVTTFSVKDATSIVWHPVEQWLAISDEYGNLRIRDVKHDVQLVFEETDAGEIRDIAWSPDGDYLATAHASGQIIIWRLSP